jgi:hypothetical protein
VVKQIPALAKFSDDVDGVVSVVHLVELDDVGVVQSAEDLEFIDETESCLETEVQFVYTLHGTGLACAPLTGPKYAPEGTLPYFAQ